MHHALLCVLALGLAEGAGESSGNPHLAPARQLLREFKEEEALKVLAKAQRWPQNTPQDLAQTHLLMGLAWAALAREDKAIESFRHARVLEPQLTLPEEEQSPRVKDWWARAAPEAPAVVPEVEAPTPPVVVEPEVHLTPATPQAVQPQLVEPTSKPIPASRWVGAAGLGAGAVLVAIAVLQGVSANTHLSNSQRLPGIGEAQAEYTAAVEAAQRANWLYGLGGVCFAAGGVSLALSF